LWPPASGPIRDDIQNCHDVVIEYLTQSVRCMTTGGHKGRPYARMLRLHCNIVLSVQHGGTKQRRRL
jgi:hypothetical protein